MYTNKVLFATLLINIMLTPLDAQIQNGNMDIDWELLKEAEGISIYKKKHGSGFNTIKIETEIKASLHQINEFLSDIDHFPDWIYRCDSTKILKTKSNKLNYLITIQFPFPFLSRYACIESIHKIDDHKLVITSENIMREMDFPKMVQIPFLSARWEANTSSLDHVNIKYVMTSDPGGNIPAWLYNLFFVEAPFQTIVNLKREIHSTEIE